MTRLSSLCPAAVVVVSLCAATPAAAQVALISQAEAVRPLATRVSQGDLRGAVRDDHGKPLAGAVVSAVGATSAFAVSEPDGTFVLRNLPAGPYLLRAHLKGYVPTGGRTVQVNAAVATVSVIALARLTESTDAAPVLEAGLGGSSRIDEGSTPQEPDLAEPDEVAWRLRHLRRSILKDAAFGDTPYIDRVFLDAPGGRDDALRPVNLPSGWLPEMSLDGQINLLTRSSFDRPQDLFSANGQAARGITYVSLSAPTVGGHWSMRGAMSQGDISSWILSGDYARSTPAVHQYETGVSYGTQRALGGRFDALAAVSGDGARNVGAVYAYDNWAVTPALSLAYGGKYARYDYLDDRGLLSPRVAVTLTPFHDSSVRIRASASRNEVAPGAEEFLPPSTGLWLPPERTFSPLTPRRSLTAERIDRVEVSAEREWVGDFVIGVRAFRENVDDQIVTLFGSSASNAPAGLSHYYVGSGGDFDSTGWGVRLSRDVRDGIRASVDYTQTDAEWVRPSPDSARLARVAASAVRSASERIYDLTASMESEVPSTATRVLVIYKLNSAFATADPSAERRAGLRFDVQVNQALPFMNFTGAQFELLVAVRNLFREDMRDGSVYDELLVIRPPKGVVGGLMVRF